jgi:methionyl-tRNA formyltransferase
VNSEDTKEFLARLKPDLMIARCKVILKQSIFEIARLGTYVMHPGICPKYRNAHGCFWALAEGDLQNVGMTLLKVDKGVDTGPVFGFFSYPYNELTESHIVIQHRVVFENLDRIRDKFMQIENGTAATIDTRGHSSGTWGQPWLSRYLSWKNAAKTRAKKYEPDIAALS